MKRSASLGLLSALLLGAVPALAQTPAPTPAVGRKAPPRAKKSPAAGTADPATDRERTLYTMGAMLGFPVSSLELTEADVAWIRQGLTDSAAGRPLRVPPASWMPKVSEFTRTRLAEVASLQKSRDEPFVRRKAAETGTVKHPSGLLFRETRAGTKPGPEKTGKVLVAYTGTLPDGTVFDSSNPAGRAIVFDLEKTIPCWQAALPLMKAGGRAHVVCPPELAWGDVGNPPLVKPGATVVYDIELLDLPK